MALQALGAYAERVYSPSFNITVKAQMGSDKTSFSVTPDNSVVLQSYEVGYSLSLRESSRHGLERPCGYLADILF